MPKLSKRAKHNEPLVPTTPLELASAVSMLKKLKGPKFDQTIDLALSLGIDPKQADQAIRGSVSLPKGIGKNKRVVAFCQDDVAAKAKDAGAVEAGGEDLAEKIAGGWFDFDVVVASPDMMRVASRLGKVLGPKGLMPSPKNGTVTPDVPTAVKEFAAGKVEYRNDKSGNVHAVIGKMSFPEGDLMENLQFFIDTIEKARPSAAKGVFIKRAVISGTMTPGIELKIN